MAPTIPLDEHLTASATRVAKQREALTKHFDPSQPRDKNGRWIKVGDLVEVAIENHGAGSSTTIGNYVRPSGDSHHEVRLGGGKIGVVPTENLRAADGAIYESRRRYAEAASTQLRRGAKPAEVGLKLKTVKDDKAVSRFRPDTIHEVSHPEHGVLGHVGKFQSEGSPVTNSTGKIRIGTVGAGTKWYAEDHKRVDSTVPGGFRSKREALEGLLESSSQRAASEARVLHMSDLELQDELKRAMHIGMRGAYPGILRAEISRRSS